MLKFTFTRKGVAAIGKRNLQQIGRNAIGAAAMQWFEQYGVWIVFIAGFSPIPYKVFTISAGVLGMMFIPFVIASFFGRWKNNFHFLHIQNFDL